MRNFSNIIAMKQYNNKTMEQSVNSYYFVNLL